MHVFKKKRTENLLKSCDNEEEVEGSLSLIQEMALHCKLCTMKTDENSHAFQRYGNERTQLFLVVFKMMLPAAGYCSEEFLHQCRSTLKQKSYYIRHKGFFPLPLCHYHTIIPLNLNIQVQRFFWISMFTHSFQISTPCDNFIHQM